MPRIALRLAALSLVVASSWLLTACGGQCRQVRSDYQQALEQETELSQERPTGDEPAQMGVAVRTSLLDEAASVALGEALASGLETLSEVDVGGGQAVEVSTRGELVNLTVDASDACEHCFEITGELDGSADLQVPMVGEHRADLSGGLSIVAPLIVAPSDTGGGALALDLSEAARIGKSSLTARLDGVRSSWARVLRSSLSDILLDELIGAAEPVELVSFEMPRFGIPGLEIFPVRMVSDAESDTIFAGFATNIAGLREVSGVEAAARLEDDQNLAFAFHPDLVVHGVSLMMQKDVVSRTYTTDGRPLRAGPAHASIREVSFSKGRIGELPMGLDFRVFNMPDDGGACFWFDGRAEGRIALRGRNLEVSLTDFEVTDASMAGVARAVQWRQAGFLEGGKQIVRESLDAHNVAVPGGQLEFKGLSLELADGAVVLKGVSALQAPRASR